MADERTTEESGGNPPAGKKKLLIMAAIGIVLLLGGGVGGAWFLGFPDRGETAELSAEAAASAKLAAAAKRRDSVVFVDTPDVLVNLQATGQRTRFLKLKVSLEVADETAANQVKTLMPRVMDSFQTYLRALTIDEISAAGALLRLKEELTARVNLALEPTRVDDVLVKEMLVQ